MSPSRFSNQQRQNLAACQSLARSRLKTGASSICQEILGTRSLSLAAVGLTDRHMGLEISLSLQQIFRQVGFSRRSTEATPAFS